MTTRCAPLEKRLPVGWRLRAILQHALRCGLVPWSAGALGALLLAGAPPPACGQFAAPSIVPFTFVTPNPAAMQWGAPSSVGAAESQSQQVSGAQGDKQNFLGAAAGLRLVGDYVSAAVEGSHEESRFQGLNSHTDLYAGALGLRLNDLLTLGIGQTHQDVRQGISASPAPFNLPQQNAGLDGDSPALGLSLRLGETFFIGAAEARDYVKFTDLSYLPGPPVTTYRNQVLYGLGFRWGGAVLAHLEAYGIDKADYVDPAVVGGKETVRGGTLEFNIHGFLLAYNLSHTDRDAGFNSTDHGVLDIGYAPRQGLSIVAHGDVQQDSYPATA
ncbi:MAG TPA: hypothetical protein VL359_10360, partial [bacterium]|nr:hypothetical protein [bacterium]